MQKYRVSKDSMHRLGFSTAIGGVWLDPGEWAYQKQAGLADKLNTILSTAWQKGIRTEASKENFEQMYRDKFGAADYEKIKEIRQWLTTHPQTEALRAFLNAQNPWSATNH